MTDRPFLLFAVTLAGLWLAVYLGELLSVRIRRLTADEHADFDIVRSATLTLLGLIIGFSFSMAVTRYDQRRNYEEAEANAIGTEFARADLLSAEDAASVRGLLRRYLEQRIAFYAGHDSRSVTGIDEETAKLEGQLWSAVLRSANANQSAVMALAVSGMNDVLNARGYTQAAWWNRIPNAAWAMMGVIAFASHLMVGYGARQRGALFFALPLIVSTAFLLIADIDSPGGGIIRVPAQNLVALAQSLKTQ